jgi:hypothetical protein
MLSKQAEFSLAIKSPLLIGLNKYQNNSFSSSNADGIINLGTGADNFSILTS